MEIFSKFCLLLFELFPGVKQVMQDQINALQAELSVLDGERDTLGSEVDMLHEKLEEKTQVIDALQLDIKQVIKYL